MHTTFPDNPAPDFNTWSNYIDSLIKDRPAEYGSGKTTEYRGFTISDRFIISKDGKPVKFPQQWSLAACKNMIDTSIAMNKLQDKGAALRKLTSGSCELESGNEDAERFSNWMQDEAEKQIHSYDN